VGSRSPHDGHFQFTSRYARPASGHRAGRGHPPGLGQPQQHTGRHEDDQEHAEELARPHLALAPLPEGLAEGPPALVGPLLREVGLVIRPRGGTILDLLRCPASRSPAPTSSFPTGPRSGPRPAPTPARAWSASRAARPRSSGTSTPRSGAATSGSSASAGRDDQIRARLGDPAVSLHLLTVAGAPAGFFELERHHDGSVEVSYFGLLPEFHGRGLGKHMLTEAAEAAWALGASRVWLHTCTLDHPRALANYLGRGFRVFKTEAYEATLPG